MKLRRDEAPAPLSPQLRRILLEGPFVLGLTLHDIPDHDELRRLWAIHGPTLRKQARRPWFLDRDEFVKTVRGEP